LRKRKDGVRGVTYNGLRMTSGVLFSEDMVREALREVIDPELGENLVDLGLVYGAQVEEGQVRVDLTLTTPGCPLHGGQAAGASTGGTCTTGGPR
jgi:hypothetical protein